MDDIQKFQDLLKGLFQFEASDLDFGIYRILNYKRGQIGRFVEKNLKNRVESAFAKHKGQRLTEMNQRFEEVKQELLDAARKLGKEPITRTGKIKSEFRDSDLGRKYLSLKRQKDEAESIDEIKLQVFNDLYSFFSRFYQEGDFVPQYRYSIKGHKYAIPYNGEEVRLCWANSEQYYTKTGLLFRDYTFKADGCKVIFRVVSAREELGSKKATKARFFVLDDDNPVDRPNDKVLIICFQYRELTEREIKDYGVQGGSNTAKQEKINQKTYEETLAKIEAIAVGALLSRGHKNEKPLLLHQISRFTAKNTKDYFIHKNLNRFLSEQLDYFIKAEVLSVETLEKERFLDKHITRAKVVREIGEDIIDFLSQIEDFQKRLWEKKKFVLRTEYVITTDRVPDNLHQEIWNNEDQKKEWEELGFDGPKTEQELTKKRLPIDTRYFKQEFKERLLEQLTEDADLDDLLEGLVVKSENWQALNLLSAKYKGSAKCIYIDPPFNSKTTEILYRNFYKHSSWLSLMENRILQGKQLLDDKGVFICAIDENEQERFGLLLEALFPAHERTCVAIVHNPGGIQGQNFSYCHEYAYFVFPSDGEYIGRVRRDKADRVPLRDWGGEESKRESARNCFYPIYVRDDRIVGFGDVCPPDFHPASANVANADGTISIYPIDNDGVERKWRHARHTIEKIGNQLKCERVGGEKVIIRYKSVYRYKTVWTDKKYNSNTYGSKLLNDMFGRSTFTFPKSLYNVSDCIHAATQNSEDPLILDFFSGSGTTAHAIMKLNKDDGCKRKYVLVESADYFDTVIIPRLKKLSYSFNWKGGKPQDTDGIGQFFQYHVLEQYEDTLNNIGLTRNRQAELKFGDDYLLKYFLDYETREDPSLLNIDQLKNPFAYRVSVNLEEVGEPQEMGVDMPETFNYLLGLKVRKTKARNDNGKYVFILGEKEGRDIAVVWREYRNDWTEGDFRKDKEFIVKELESWAPHVVYVNGQSVLTPTMGKNTAEIRYVEPEFKNLMG